MCGPTHLKHCRPCSGDELVVCFYAADERGSVSHPAPEIQRSIVEVPAQVAEKDSHVDGRVPRRPVPVKKDSAGRKVLVICRHEMSITSSCSWLSQEPNVTVAAVAGISPSCKHNTDS